MHSHWQGVLMLVLFLSQQHFNQGDTFGELALLDVNNERTATVIAKEPTELLRVDRSEFSGLLSRSQLDDLQAKYQYLRQVFSGPAWTDTDLRAAACHTHVRSFRAGQIVFNGGQRDTPYMEHLAVVVEGAAVAIRTLRVSCRPHTGQLRLARGGDSESGAGRDDSRTDCMLPVFFCFCFFCQPFPSLLFVIASGLRPARSCGGGCQGSAASHSQAAHGAAGRDCRQMPLHLPCCLSRRRAAPRSLPAPVPRRFLHLP